MTTLDIPRTRITVEHQPAIIVRAATRTAVLDRRPALAIRAPRELRITTGRQGPRGRPGTAEGYLHQQPSPSTNWTIAHNLAYRPSVELRTIGGVLMDGQVTHVSDNLITVAFAYALAGSARLL